MKFVRLNIGLDNPHCDMVIEPAVTVRGGVVALTHCGGNCDSTTPTACKQALTCDLPDKDSCVGYYGVDINTLTAMAVLSCREQNLPIDESLVGDVDLFCREGYSVQSKIKSFQRVMALWETACIYFHFQGRVEYAMAILEHKMDLETIEWLTGRRESMLAQIRQTSRIFTFDLSPDDPQGRQIAFVVSQHPFGYLAGFAKGCDVVVQHNNLTPFVVDDVPNGETFLGYTIARWDCQTRLDIAKLRGYLNTFGWDNGMQSPWLIYENMLISPNGWWSRPDGAPMVTTVAKHCVASQDAGRTGNYVLTQAMKQLDINVFR